MLATIVLPPGTERVTLGDIPRLFADAIHPPVPEDTPRILSYLQKEATTRELAWQWCGQGDNFPISLSADDLQALNSGPWAALPPLELLAENNEGPTKLKTTLTEPEWEPYRLAFEAAPPEGWRLIAVWRNTVFEQWLMNHEARKEWKKLLEQQARHGGLAARSPTTLIPTPGMVGRQLQDGFLTVPEFAEFAAKFSVSVRVQRAFVRKPLASQLLDALRKEPPDESILVNEAIGSFSGQSSWLVREWVSHLEAIVDRQSRGYFTVGEAAQMLSDANRSIDVKDLIGRMGAAKVGNPPRRLVRGPHLLPLLDGAEYKEYMDLVKVQEVDEWLASLGVPYTLSALCPTQKGSPGSLVVQINGREAVPVRAIPYVTGWNISPDDLAKQLARKGGEGFERLENTSAYYMNGTAPQKMLPKEWDRYVADLAGLEAGLKGRFQDHDEGYAVWRSQSAEKLPAGVFVWRDEFDADYQRDFSSDALTYLREREGDRELTYSPMLEAHIRQMVFAGFEAGSPEEVRYELPLFARLEPRTPWSGGRMAATDILPIADAAKLATRHAGEEVTIGDFLRAGARGEIRIRAVCPRTVSMLPVKRGDIVLTMQQGSYPTLPQDACEMLSITGRAAWRICEGSEPVEMFGGAFCRFTRWRLPDGEPDLVTTINDCLVMGSDVHALADAFTPDEVLMDDRPYDEKAAASDVVLMTSPVRSDASRVPDRAKEEVLEKEQTSAPVFSMTRAALVKAHEHRWPTIQSDLKNASANGLSKAKAGARDWNEALALEWARANGKLEDDAPAAADPLGQAMRNLSALPGRKNVLKG